jgi:hypothetical protein
MNEDDGGPTARIAVVEPHPIDDDKGRILRSAWQRPGMKLMTSKCKHADDPYAKSENAEAPKR